MNLEQEIEKFVNEHKNELVGQMGIRQAAHHFYNLGHETACRAQYHDFQQGEKHAAQNIIEMIHNGWHLNAIEALCREKIEAAGKEDLK